MRLWVRNPQPTAHSHSTLAKRISAATIGGSLAEAWPVLPVPLERRDPESTVAAPLSPLDEYLPADPSHGTGG